MATLVGSLISAIGAKMTASFPTYSVIYGLPAPGGAFVEIVDTIRVHYLQESSKAQGNQVGSPDVVNPIIIVSLSRSSDDDQTTLESAQEKLDLLADLRVAVVNMVMDHVTGVAPLLAFLPVVIIVISKMDYKWTCCVVFCGTNLGIFFKIEKNLLVLQGQFSFSVRHYFY